MLILWREAIRTARNRGQKKPNKIVNTSIFVWLFSSVLIYGIGMTVFKAANDDVTLATAMVLGIIPMSVYAFKAGKKEKLNEKAYDLLLTAKGYASAANKAESFTEFIKCFDGALYALRRLSEYEGKVHFDDMLPSENLERLQREEQWHMRDALERETDHIIADAKGKYRNNKQYIAAQCDLFQASIDTYWVRMDDETRAFSRDMLSRLQRECKSFSPKSSAVVSEPEARTAYNASSLSSIDQMEGHDFEYWCADLLRANGFQNVEVTRGSGDQGVDVLAEKGDARYAIQCKCYSSDLGNKPVQEVYAGKNIYQCDVAVVMTNRYFTQGAKDAAAATRVRLWDRDKLAEMVAAAGRK